MQKTYKIDLDEASLALVIDGLTREYADRKEFSKGSDWEVEQIAKLTKLIESLEDMRSGK